MKKCFLIVITLFLLSVMLSSCAGGLYPEGDYVDENGNYYTFSDAQGGEDSSGLIFYTEDGKLVKSGHYYRYADNTITANWKDGTNEVIGTYVQKTKSINIDGKIVYQHHGM